MAATYDPNAVNQNGKDRIRFELGDTDPDDAELQDEEIEAILETQSEATVPWLRSAAMLARVVHRRYSRQATFSVGTIKFDYQGRAEQWGKLADSLEVQAGVGIAGASTSAAPSAGGVAALGENYFYKGMHDA